MTTALITGVCGFCGAHLVARLRNEGDIRIVGIDIRSDTPIGVLLDEYRSVDIRDSQQVASVIRHVRPDLIFHLVGVLKGSASDLYQANLMGGINVLESVRQYAPDARVLIVGSAAEYGRVSSSEMPIKEDRTCAPSGAYALSKYALTLAALDYARNRGLKVVVARPFNIIGSGVPPSLVVGAILNRAKQALQSSDDPAIIVGNLDAERDFIVVEDVMDAYTRLLLGNHSGEVFNICSGEPRTVRSVAEELLSFSPRPIRLKVSPSLIRFDDVKTVYGSWKKANLAIGFRPKKKLSDALQAAWRHEIRDT